MAGFRLSAWLLSTAVIGLAASAGAQTAPAPRPQPARASNPVAAPSPTTANTPPGAAQKAAPAADRSSALGNLGSSKEPIKIDSDRLDVFDKEGRAVFTGNVVAVQGDTTMQCTVMTVFYEQNKAAGGAKTSAGPSQGDSAVKKIDCKGPVTVVSKTQTATGDRAEFDRAANKVVMTGNVALSDGPNVTRGERLVYDTNTGVANVETTPGGRVKALFIPGSGEPKTDDKKADDKKPDDKKGGDKKAAERKPEPQKRNAAAN